VKYRCRKCEKGFDIPAYVSYSVPWVNPRLVTSLSWPFTSPPSNVIFNYNVSVPCCPFCNSTAIEEAKAE